MNELEYRGAVQPLRGSSFNTREWNSTRKTVSRSASGNTSASDSEKDLAAKGRAYESSSESDSDGFCTSPES